MKGAIRNETIKYTPFKKRQDTEKELTLKTEIITAENKLINSKQNNDTNNIKNELDL